LMHTTHKSPHSSQNPIRCQSTKPPLGASTTSPVNPTAHEDASLIALSSAGPNSPPPRKPPSELKARLTGRLGQF
jgi:hypothetical protein